MFEEKRADGNDAAEGMEASPEKFTALAGAEGSDAWTGDGGGRRMSFRGVTVVAIKKESSSE